MSNYRVVKIKTVNGSFRTDNERQQCKKEYESKGYRTIGQYVNQIDGFNIYFISLQKDKEILND